MKILNFITKATLILLIPLIYSCEKAAPLPTIKESTLYLSIMSELLTKTKAKTFHSNKKNNNQINRLDIFVFNNSPESAVFHTLDTYKSITADKITGVDILQDIEIKTTTGEKIIIVIANSHSPNLSSITSLSDFTSQQSLLTNEKEGEFTMSGSLNASLESITNLPFLLTRLVGRIQLNSIKTNFAGTPYQGHSLSDIKIYLTNIHGNKEYLGSPSKNTIIHNQGKLIENQAEKFALSGISHEEISTPINDKGYNTKHYFYAYENTLEQEDDTRKFTQLLIEAKLNGILYYYPININQKGFGYTPENRHKGIMRNTSYSVDIIIERAGSIYPDLPVEDGSLSTNIYISNWEHSPHTNIEF